MVGAGAVSAVGGAPSARGGGGGGGVVRIECPSLGATTFAAHGGYEPGEMALSATSASALWGTVPTATQLATARDGGAGLVLLGRTATASTAADVQAERLPLSGATPVTQLTAAFAFLAAANGETDDGDAPLRFVLERAHVDFGTEPALLETNSTLELRAALVRGKLDEPLRLVAHSIAVDALSLVDADGLSRNASAETVAARAASGAGFGGNGARPIAENGGIGGASFGNPTVAAMGSAGNGAADVGMFRLFCVVV